MVCEKAIQTLSIFLRGELVKKILDSKYIGYLLLEAMYHKGQLNLGTYERVLKSKDRYIRSQKSNTKLSRNKQAA